MFYSHQLLARKAPLGQIWMAATMHAKINRRKLDKLDIIKICEEILNPSVPMALRLSGILMGGVVIVYERKVKLLYDDVTRFMMEINEAWKVKPVSDPTLLPKGKIQAKFEAVTLPENVDVEDLHPLPFSDASFSATRFQRLQLDNLDELYINIDTREEDLTENHHQADAANITLFDDFGSCYETDFNRFERFDLQEEEDETGYNINAHEQPQAPSTLIPSSPHEHPEAPSSDIAYAPPTEDSPKVEEGIRNIFAGQQGQQVPNSRRKQLAKRKARRNFSTMVIDDEQIMIPGNIYQSWLRDASNIIKKRRRNIKLKNPILSTKIGNLMDLPPVALLSSIDSFPDEVRYPAPLMELWRKYNDLCSGASSSSGATPSPEVCIRKSHSPPEELNQTSPEAPRDQMESLPEDISIEKLRGNLDNVVFEGMNEDLFANQFVTPGSPGQSSRSRSISSSGSGNSFMQLEPELPLPTIRSKKRQPSSSRTGLGNLDTVEEEFPLEQSVRDFKIRRISETGPTQDFELMEESGPTQTPHQSIPDPSTDKITQSIRTHLKLHFDTPGAPQVESLEQLASGMSRKKAAQLFYQTCVLATCAFLKVRQREPFADIFISRGPKISHAQV